MSDQAYAETLAALDDGAFVKAAEMQIWLSAFANNNPRAPAHKKADAAYDEAVRRDKPWLYQRAWNAAWQSCGHELSDSDREKARETSRPQGVPDGPTGQDGQHKTPPYPLSGDQ